MINSAAITSRQLRDYGLIMGAAVAIIFGIYPWAILKKTLVCWPFYALGMFWAVAVVYPKILAPLYKVWMGIGFVLGRINSTIILSFCYFILFVPVAVLFRLIKRDRLQRYPSRSEKTFRKVRELKVQASHMDNPF